MKSLFVFTLLLISLGSFAQGGQSMPEIILKDVNGNNKNCADYSKSGKITIVTFWATWCTPCKKELTNIVDNLLEDWKNKYDVALVAVSTDDSKNVLKVKPYATAQGWDFDVLLDLNMALLKAVNGTNVPYTILLDKNGKVVYQHTGYIEGDEYMLQDKIKELSGTK